MTVLDDTMGFLLIGVIISGVLYGVSCSQAYYYFTRYANDPWPLKLLVTAVWVTDSVHQGLITYSVYWYLVLEYNNPAAISQLTKTIVVEVLFNAFTGLFVQSFFVVRIYKLNMSRKKLYLVVPVMCLVVAEFAVSATYMFEVCTFKTFADLHKVRGLVICVNAFAAAADVAIAAVLCTILHTSRTHCSKSNTLINKLIVFTLNTGLLTSVCACISLITFFALPNTFAYICFYFLIGRLYAISLMATLNARKRLREGLGNEVSLSFCDIQVGPTITTFAPCGVTRRGDDIAIRIDTTKESKRDDAGINGEMDVDVEADGDLGRANKTQHSDFRLSHDWINPQDSAVPPSPGSEQWSLDPTLPV